jgi:hypothetical protein
MQTISSQHHINDEIVAEKLAAHDFEVLVSPAFEYASATVRVVLDGHHSLAAAKLAGVEPEYLTATATDNDQVALLGRGDFEGFLEAAWMDGDYYDVDTQECVW